MVYTLHTPQQQLEIRVNTFDIFLKEVECLLLFTLNCPSSLVENLCEELQNEVKK